MKHIDTLIPDIQGLLKDMGGIKLSHVSAFSDQLAKRIATRVEEERSTGTLRLSNLGTPCKRKLWYSINVPGMAEALTADTHLKFLYGDILEETILWLAKESGHLVVGEQNEINLFGVIGHIDAIVDGILLDVKSASSPSFNRFTAGLLPANDSFGYLGQIDSYLHGLASSPAVLLLSDISRAGFLVIDKTLGKICLDFHPRSVVNYEKVVDDAKRSISSRVPPERYYQDEPFGKSGNYKLGMVCSYCPFKRKCWPGVRAFAYSTGPVFLTKVVRAPDVLEIK